MTSEMVHPMTVMTRGEVPDESVAYATRRLGSLIGHIAEPVLLARVKLTHAPHRALESAGHRRGHRRHQR